MKYIYIPRDYLTGIKIKKVRAFARKVKVGGKVTDNKGRQVTVLKKYRNVVLTSGGCFQWIDIYMHTVKKVTTTADGYLYQVEL